MGKLSRLILFFTGGEEDEDRDETVPDTEEMSPGEDNTEEV